MSTNLLMRNAATSSPPGGGRTLLYSNKSLISAGCRNATVRQHHGTKHEAPISRWGISGDYVPSPFLTLLEGGGHG